LSGVWNGASGSRSSRRNASSLEAVRASWIESPQEVIAWQQTTAKDLHGFCPSLSRDCIGISECALVVPDAATCISRLVFSQPLLLRPSVSDKAQMPDRIEIERRNRMSGV
jgi:hypothetical protein